MKNIEVVAAIIERSNTILCVQRGLSRHGYTSKKWEFAGGKVEEGETNEQALEREIDEELSLVITVGEKIITVQHTYPDFAITMHCYRCTIVANADGIVKEPTLHEHLASVWLNKSELNSLDWAAADIPVVGKLMTL